MAVDFHDVSNVASALFGALSAYFAWRARVNTHRTQTVIENVEKNVAIVETATNGMKAALVEKTDIAGAARGYEQARLEGEAKALTLAATVAAELAEKHKADALTVAAAIVAAAEAARRVKDEAALAAATVLKTASTAAESGGK